MAVKRLFPSDLILVVGLTILTDVFVLIPALSGNYIRTVLGLSLVLFSPGYALTAAIFPAKTDINLIERTTLSFVLSIAAVILIGFGINYTPWGIRSLPILISLSLFTFFMCCAAYYRRQQFSEDEAFSVPFKTSFLALMTNILEKPEEKTDKILKLILVLSLLASVVTLMYIIVSPKEGEHFTEFYILGPQGMVNNYPTQYMLGGDGTIIIGIINHEFKPMNYTLKVKIDNRSLILSKNLQYISLAHNATWEEPLIIAPPFEGKNLKLEFLLFKEKEENVPYRSLHLWINVEKKEGKSDG